MIHFRESHSLQRQVDWRNFPTVVIESDDWGACEYAPNRDVWEQERCSISAEKFQPFQNGKLESPEEMERFASLLQSFLGKDGVPATVTGFVCLANPNFEKIEASGFQEYHDIFVNEGFPAGWNGAGVVEAWRRAMAKGVFVPEYHTRLHHLNANVWLKLLRENSVIRNRFAKGIYCPDEHIPEYQGMRPMEMKEWIAPAVDAFEKTFGFCAEAAVSSDATALTEILWAAHGLRIFCLRNFSIPGAPPITYHTKQWNNQDPATPQGAWNPETDVIYTNRNIFFEPAFDPDYSFDTILGQVEEVWARNEPAVISTHRINYSNWDESIAERGLGELQRLLEALAETPNIEFMSTREMAQIYRTGHAVREVQGRKMERSRPVGN